ESRPPQRREQPVTGPIAGEDPAGPVAAMRRRGEPEDAHAGVRIPEPGQRATPVRLARIRRAFHPRHLLAPLHQPRAPPALDDLLLDRVERRHESSAADASTPLRSRSITGASSTTSVGTPRRT